MLNTQSFHALALCCMVFVAGCRSEDDPNAGVPPPAAEATTPPPFPNLRPFAASRMWKLLKKPSPAAARAELKKLRALPKPKSETHKKAEPDSLPGAVAIGRRSTYMMVPMVIAALEPIWSKASWTEDERALVQETVDHLHDTVGAPKAEFGDDPKRNWTGLARLASWFEAEVKKPAVLAAMIFTMDDGPYRGLDDPKAATALRDPQRRKFGDSFELRLGKLDGHWLLRCARSNKILWSRVMSQDGAPISVEIRLRDAEPDRLDEVAWKLHLSCGGEYCHVYISPAGELLFYFVSW